MAMVSSSLLAKESFSRKDLKRYDFLKDYNDSSLQQLRLQAEYLSAHDDPLGAIHLYEILIKMGEVMKTDTLEFELIIAALEIEAGRPDKALRRVSTFGHKHPDSPLINRAVQLAFILGKGYALSTSEDYSVIFRNSKAIRSMEFVDEHDPYSLEAAEGLLTVATLRMNSKDFTEALVNLQTILRRQPGTEIAAQTEVHIAECYLGLHKGSPYDLKALREAIRYLTSYINHQPNGAFKDRATELLAMSNRRLGRR